MSNMIKVTPIVTNLFGTKVKRTLVPLLVNLDHIESITRGVIQMTEYACLNFVGLWGSSWYVKEPVSYFTAPQVPTKEGDSNEDE